MFIYECLFSNVYLNLILPMCNITINPQRHVQKHFCSYKCICSSNILTLVILLILSKHSCIPNRFYISDHTNSSSFIRQHSLDENYISKISSLITFLLTNSVRITNSTFFKNMIYVFNKKK